MAIELVLSMTPEWFDGLTEDRHALRQHPKFIEWVDTSIAWARKEFGQNVIDVAVHMDESSPHMHVLAVPLTQEGRLCAKEVLARTELMRRQTSYAKAMEPFGVQRGVPAKVTKRRHIKLTEKPQGGGKASELAAQLAAANSTIAQLQQQVQQLQGLNVDYSRQITALEKRIEQAQRLATFEKQIKAEMAAKKPRRDLPDDQETAMALFLEKHKALPYCTPQEASGGSLVASEGRFAVLHLGHGRHALVEFPSAQAVQELARGQQQGPGRAPGR